MKKALFLLFFAGVLFSLRVSTAHSADEATAGDYFYGMGAQFGRGLVQIVTSPADIPCEMVFETKENGASGLATGFGKGTLFMLRRLLVGVSEVGTFFLPEERTIPPACTHTNPVEQAGVQG